MRNKAQKILTGMFILTAVFMFQAPSARAAIGAEDDHTGETWLIDGGPGVTNWSANVFIGNTGTDNALIITNGGSLHLGASNAYLLLGDKEGGNSNQVVVTGDGSRLTVTTGRDIEIGRGTGTADTVEDPGGDYNILVVEDDAYLATRRLHVGLRGSNNQLVIRDGAEMLLTGWLRVGHVRGAENNEAHISGEGTTLTTPRIEIGEQAFDDYSGSLLDISDKAVVNVSEHIRIVSGTDSEIRVRGQAQVTSASVYISGRNNANDNSIVISGEGTTWTNTGSFIVNNTGANASGTRLEIRDGAVLNAASQEGTMEVRANGTLLLDAGTLITPELLVLDGGTLEGAGTIDGGGDIAGVINPGLSAGTLTFTGDLVLREGFAVHFKLGGPGAGQSDQIVCGVLDLDGDGTLYLSALPGYTPSSEGDRIVLFDFDSLTTEGATFLVDESALPAGWSVDDSDLMLDGSITVIPEPASAVLLAASVAVMLLRRRYRS